MIYIKLCCLGWLFGQILAQAVTGATLTNTKLWVNLVAVSIVMALEIIQRSQEVRREKQEFKSRYNLPKEGKNE